jgi:hypothetical protein
VAQPIYPTNKGVLVHSLSGNNDMAVKSFTQADGSIVIVGDSSGQITLTRYTSTGALDTDFGSNGLLKTDFITNDQEYAADAVMQADGKILVTGGSYGSSAILARYNAAHSTHHSVTKEKSSIRSGSVASRRPYRMMEESWLQSGARTGQAYW